MILDDGHIDEVGDGANDLTTPGETYTRENWFDPTRTKPSHTSNIL